MIKYFRPLTSIFLIWLPIGLIPFPSEALSEEKIVIGLVQLSTYEPEEKMSSQLKELNSQLSILNKIIKTITTSERIKI